MRKCGSGVVEEDALQSNPVHQVQPRLSDHPEEVVRVWAGRLLGDLEDLEDLGNLEEKEK